MKRGGFDTFRNSRILAEKRQMWNVDVGGSVCFRVNGVSFHLWHAKRGACGRERMFKRKELKSIINSHLKCVHFQRS